MLELKKLSAADGEDIYEMLQEIPAEENGFMNSCRGKSFEEFKEWLEKCVESSRRTEIIDGWRVPDTVFWLYDDGKPVGMGKVRHFLTDALRAAGGNIGYAIRPTARCKGLGKALLGMLIKEARAIGVSEILITVHEDNIASLRVALANGGVVLKRENGRYYVNIE